MSSTKPLSSAAPRPRGGIVKRYGLWLAVAILFLALPHVFTSGTSITKMNLMGIMIVFALSNNMLLGQTGMLSFGHAVFYGLGGFLAVHGMNVVAHNHLPVPTVLIPLVGGFAGLFFGVIFGAVATRRAGTAFAMISLGIGELVGALSLILRGFFGGEEGVSANRTRGLPVLHWNFGPDIQVYYLIAAWCFLCIVAMYAITRTPLGRMCNAVRDNPERAEFIGYSTQRVRFRAYVFAGLFAGIAGGLTAINFELMTATNVGAAESGLVLLMTYIGGAGNFAGPILGAVLITMIQVSLSDVTSAWLLYLGLLFILIVMYAPNGLAGLIMMHEPLWRGGTLRRVLPSYGLALLPAAVLFAGAVLLIELAYRLGNLSDSGGALTIYSLEFNALSPWSWLLAVVLAVGGLMLLRRTFGTVSAAWSEALEDVRGSAPR